MSSRQRPPRGSRPGLKPSGAKPVDAPGAPRRKVFTVARLLQDVQQQLEAGFGTVWLQAEISNLSRPSSGHLYFSLKDSRAQIRCAMFKGRNQRLEFSPSDGDAVLVRGTLGLYAARGDFQLIVEHMEPAGAGRLQAAFEQTKRELDEAGWFSTEYKQALPEAPARIGVVTSPTGAALRDVLHVLRRRHPRGEVILYPTMTQGAQAAPAVSAAIAQASRRAEVDVLLVVRGGGSLEDLWAFNERAVAAAIRECPIPVISGVGHEVDVTITDLVADVRAPTPSAAAELATPDSERLLTTVHRYHLSLVQTMTRTLRAHQQRRDALEARLLARHPERLLAARARHVDELSDRLHRAAHRNRHAAMQRLATLQARLEAHHPDRQLAQTRQHLAALQLRLQSAMQRQLSDQQARLQPATRALHAVGPTAVLARGYAFLTSENGVVTHVTDVTPGTCLTATLSDGSVTTRVEEIRENPSTKSP